MRDTDKLHVNHNDVVYSQEDAAALARAFDDAAHKLGDFQGKIRSEGMHAAQEFRGRYATLFVLNYGQCMDDARRLADACHRAAEAVRKIARAAEAEQDNRRRARQAELSRDTARSVNGDKAAAFGAHEKRDPFRPAYQAQPGPEIEVNPGVSPKPTLGRLGEVPHEPAPPASIAEPKSSNSEKYAEGLASSGGTSSANPDALEKYTNFVLNTLNIEMNAAFTAVSNAYDTYLKTCQWGVLIIDTLLLSTKNWILDNDNDAAWINVVAQAFRNAGAGVKFTVSDAALASSIQQAGVNPGRKWLEVADVQVFGTQISSGYANDPVNVATGNFIEEERDLSVGSVSLVRMYNSIAAAGAASTHEGYAAPTGVFGPGWSSRVDTHLGFTASGVVWADVDGRQVFFARSGAGFARAAGEAWWLHRYTVNPAD